MTDLTTATATASALDQSTKDAVAALTVDEQEALSKALFPDTHLDHVVVLGKKRVFTPLTLKYSRMIHARLATFHEAIKRASKEDVEVDEAEIASDLADVAKILAKRYEWDDIVTAIDEEDITLEEIQALVVCQMELQSANDFLLMPLRYLVGLLRQREVVTRVLARNITIGQG